MDEQVINDLYARATSKGYKKSREEFISLLQSDSDVMNDMYSYVQSKGYRKDISDFKSLVGATTQAPVAEKVKKKGTTELPSEDGSLVSPTSVDESSFAGTLSQVGQKAQEMPRPPELPSKPIKRVDETPKETPYFTGAIGEALSLMDSPMTPYGNLGVGDFIDDIGRAVNAGLNQGGLVTPSNVLMAKGSKTSSEQIKKYIAASKDLEKLGASDEMMQFSKTYEEEGKGVYGFLKGLAQNPGILPEIMISSTAALLNPSSAAAAGTVAGGFATTGAVAGGGVPGAVAGAITSAPWAIAAAGTTLETGLTFAELLQEKLKERNLDFTEENVKTILEDEKAINSIRAKSVARGATIGIIDGFTGRLAGKVGAKLVKGTAAGKVKAGLASSGIEMVGGSTGEAAGRLVAGQEMDIAEIGLEGIAEAPLAIADVTAELLRKPIYEINGERRNEADVEFLIENADPDELSQMNIKIKNDVKGYEKRIQEVVVDNQLKKEIKQANPDANDATIDELFILEKELQKFEGNKTQSGKDRAAQIRSQIKTIQEDAIQEQAAGQVPVQSGTGISQEVAQGVSQAEPQVTAQEGVQEEVITDDKLQEIGAQIGDLIETLNVFSVNNLYNDGTSNEKRVATRRSNKALKKLGDFFGFPYGARKNKEQADKQDALYRLTTMLNQEEYADVNELMTAYKDDKAKGVKSPVVNDVDTVLGIAPEVSSKTQPEITRDFVRGLNDEQIAAAYEEIPVNLLPMAEGVSNQDAVFEAYSKAKKSGKNPELVKTIEEKIYENLPTERVQLQPGAVRPEAQATIEPAELEGLERRSPKREQVKSSIQRIANAGLLRSAETGQATITEQEIDAQIALTDAMSRVWKETTGKDDFYEAFFEDVKEGDIETIKQKGGALFQDVEVPQRPISRVSLGVFELPEFQKMKDLMVAPQSVSDLMKSRGKQIEKDIINTVLSYDKYKGQKRISFNEFKDDVETQLMKLERINTNTYASYGKDNLGDNQNYGKSETIIFNSPIDHGQFGHFRGDFMKGNLEAKTWNIRQVPNTEQYVAIDADMPAGVGQNEIAQYVGTAGPLTDVQRWVDDRNNITDNEINKGLFGHIRNWFNENTGVYTLAELQSDYFQKNKANDLYASRIPQDEVDEYVNANFRKKLDQETSDKLKEEFGIVTKVEENPYQISVVAYSKSQPDVFLGRGTRSKSETPRAGYSLIETIEHEAVVEASRVLATQDSEIAAKRREIQDDYQGKREGLKKEEYKYIAKRVEEIKKSESGNLMLSQFVASQKVHELRLFREALKHAADKGATELWFPTPYTIAVIEGYVSSTGNAPYEVVEGNSDRLYVGDIIDYGGTEMIVVDSTSISIVVAPRDEVSMYNIYELRQEEAANRVGELEYALGAQVDDINAITREEVEAFSQDEWMSDEVAKQLEEYFENNPDEETVAWTDIESEVTEYVEDYYDSMSVEDVLGWAGEVYEDGDAVYAIESRRSIESFSQPSEYESDVDESDFQDNLSEEQSTVVKKYDELGEMIKKMRPDAEVVTDNNDKRWLKTAITKDDASNPIIAFQEEGGKIKGAIDFSNDNKASVYVFDGADISTLAHEMSGHLGRRVLERLAATDERFAKDYETAKKWAGVKENQWSRGAEEKWARGFEKYLRSGKAPSKALTSVFQKLRNWLTNIYKTIKGSSIDINLTPSIISVFDNLLATQQEQSQTTKTQKQNEQVQRTGVAPAGNRLFNEPIKEIAEIANRYYQRAFGVKRPDFKGTRQLDKARAKRISDAFDAMKHLPNDPQVRAAYNALAKETIAQYQEFLDAGYVVEVNNQDTYANSQEMIDDLRNNKRIKIFSTEAGFGDTPITAKQRKENPLLAKSNFTDVNGQPMLVNDLFRAVHDFFGHSELGNSFGPLGEENAWNVHARMYSPLARRAMTTETRGQNSYVNFSGVNEEVEKIREQSRKLREEGKLEEALKLTDEIYKKTSFADQKVGLLPEEFSQIDGEIVEQPITEAEEVEEFTPMRVEDLDTDTFTRNNAIDYEEDFREDANGREYPYLSSITVEARDADGDTIGSITRLADEDGTLSFTAEDADGNQVGRGEEYYTLGDVKKALTEQVNKQRKKEFDKEQKAKAKAKARELAKQKAKEPKVEEEVVEEVRGKLDELLELDPVQKSTGQKVLDGIDGLIKDIEKFEKGTLGVNIALPIMKTILKGIRALVKGGMSLNDAIKKAAKDNNVSVRDVTNGINAISQVLPIQAEYDALMAKADALIARQKAKGIEEKKIVSNLDTMIRNSDVYKNANDAQRKIMEREARAKMGVDPRKAASIGRVIGVLKDITNVSREEKLQIISRIRELSRDVAKDLAQEIKDLNKKGKITLTQSANIIARFGKVNLLSEISVTNFVNHMTKVFADAEYANKLSAANTMRSQIRKLSKSKEKAANLRDLGAKFSKIDPSMVEDIDQYNSIAALIKDSIRGSTIRGAEVKFSNMIKESKAVEYINETMEEQQKKLFDMRVAEVQSLLGVDASELTYEQLAEMLDSKEPMTKDNEKLVRSAINKAFDIYSSLIGESMKTGKDVFTGEDVEYTPNQKKVVKEFMDMDLGLLRPKQALEAVDALMNFLQNQSIAKMQSVVSKHNGIKNAEMLEKKGIKAKPIRKYFSKGLGRLLIEQTANLNILFERMFGGFTRGGLVEEAIGVTDIKNGKSKAQSDANRVVQKYVDQFYKSTPNGQAFNTAFNNTERGMIAFMMRNVIGTEAEMQAEFNRRKELIKESIEALSKGNETEVAKATVYKEVYDKILADSKTIDDVLRKANAVNVDAVKFWQNEWDSKYEELSDVALGVYNKILDKDINYNPDRYSKLSSDTGDVELSTEDMTFIFNSGNSPIYKRETGVLMAATRPESLPRNEKSGEPSRYIDLSFDSNNGNSYYDALVDINTAAPIRQVEAALNSSAFKRIVPEANDRKLLENRVKLYVNNIRKKNPFSDDEFSKAMKGLNRIAAIGVGQALGGVFQPIKQSIPIAVNTLINAGGLDMASVFSEAKQAFIDKSGYAIANRGIASQAQIDTLNKMIDEAANSKPEQAFKAIEKVNNWWLKNLLVRFDVAIARASWMTYYEQSLKKQGIDTANIDYNTHEVNADAADYAQRQVDRQQNVSDADLAGELLASKDSTKQLIVKVLMPFASFRMNQSARVGADVSTLTNLTSTIEDKKIAARSLAGFAAEMVTFRALSVGSALLIAEVVKAVMDRDDDEEKDEKKKDSIIKGQLTNTVADVFSPTPLIDKAIQMGASKVLDATQDALEVDEEERLEIYSGNKQDFFQSLGLLGIAGARAYQLYEMTKLSSGFAFEDSYGNVKYLTEEDKEAIAMLIPIAIVSNIGLTPSEVNSVVRSSLSDAKRAAKKDENASAAVKSMNKGDLKKYNPELYDQLYGPNSPNYETEQMMKQMREENEAMMKQMKDEMYR